MEKYNIKDRIELILEKEHIILKPIAKPRKDWAKEFEKMQMENDDTLLINNVFNDEYFDEWK